MAYNPDPELYSPPINSYTSNSEFFANKRTQITNEVPPYDIYDGVHRLLKDGDMWRWFFGWSFHDPKVSFNTITNGKEVFDKQGQILQASIAKYVNGVRAKDYGEQPYYYYETTGPNVFQETEFIPVGSHIELYGVLLPEMDLMLHEGYRYLDTLYPDHPDFYKILTKNEMDDSFQNAAAMVDYEMDTTLMDYIGQSLPVDPSLKGEELYRAKEYESFKIKYRNITNNAFRRKLFGALQGYKMYGADIFQHMSVYPVAQYLPFEPYPMTSHTDATKDIKWFSKIFKMPNGFDERSINTYNAFYSHRFRLLDWTNETYDYSYVPPVHVWGTAHSIPGSNYDIYEFKLDDNSLIPDLNLLRDFKNGQSVTIDGKPSYINMMQEESSYLSSFDEAISATIITEVQDKVVHALVSNVSLPEYTQWNVYPGTKAMIDALDSTTNFNDYVELLDKPDPIHNSTPVLYNIYANTADGKYPRVKSGIYVLSPWQLGELYQPFAKSLSMYPDLPNVQAVPSPDQMVTTLEWSKDIPNENSYVKLGSLLANNDWSYIAECTAIKKGTLEFYNITGPGQYPDDVKELQKIQNDPIYKHGIIYKSHAFKQDVVIFGSPEFEFGDLQANGTRPVTNVKWNIGSIPRVKDYYMMRYLYPDYIETVEKKYASLLVLNPIVPDVHYWFKVVPYVNQIIRTWAIFKDAVDQLYPLAENLHLVPNDIHWSQIGLPSNPNVGYEYDFRNSLLDPEMLSDTTKSVRLREFYKSFYNKVNSYPIFISGADRYDLDLFAEAIDEFMVVHESYKIEEIRRVQGVTANILDRTWYSNIVPSGEDQELAMEQVKACDALLDIYLPNQFYLTDPLTNKDNLYMQDIGSDNILPLITEAGDELKQFIQVILDPIFLMYEDYDTFYVGGHTICKGLIHNWDFGSVYMSLLTEDNKDVLATNYLHGDYITRTPIANKADYLSVNPLAVNAQLARASTSRKWAYSTYNFIEQFQVTRMNIEGVPVKPNTVDIRGIVNTKDDPYKIQFSDPVSLQRMNILTTGDQLIAKIIFDDTFIQRIDLESHCIYVTTPLKESGDFVFTFYIALNIYPRELTPDDFYNYREPLAERGLLDLETGEPGHRVPVPKTWATPFQNGYYGSDNWPYVSEIYPNAVIDVAKFKSGTLDRLKSNNSYKINFEKIVLNNYIGNKNRYSYYALPSFINAAGDMFYEINAFMVFDWDEKKQEGYLTKTEIMDYFDDTLNITSRASDDLNVGLAINAETDSSGKYSFIFGEDYSDPNIKNKFSTYHWDVNTIPAFAEIGTGLLQDYFKPYEDEQPQPENIEDKSYYWGPQGEIEDPTRNTGSGIYDGAFELDAPESFVVHGFEPIDKRTYNSIIEHDTREINLENGNTVLSTYTKINVTKVLPAICTDYYAHLSGEDNDIDHKIIDSGSDYFAIENVNISDGPIEVVIYKKKFLTDISVNLNKAKKDNLKTKILPDGTEVLDVERTIYFKKEFEMKSTDWKRYYHIAEPIFEIPLGEYEVSLSQNYDNWANQLNKGDIYTAVQFSVIKEQFKNLKKYVEQPVIIEFENYFKNNILLDIPQGMFVDKTNNVTLIMQEYKDDLKQNHKDLFQITWDGEWTPECRYVDARQRTEIIYPPPGQDKDGYSDSYLHYYTIEKTVRMTKVYDPYEKQELEEKIFPQGSIIFWDTKYVTDGGKWTLREFVFGGLIGSSKYLNSILKPDDSKQELDTVNIANSYSPGQTSEDYFIYDAKSDPKDSGGPNCNSQGNLTIKHRLLIKLIGSTGLLKGNPKNILLYSVRELTEIFHWILNKVSDGNVAGYSLRTYSIAYASVLEMKKARISNFNSIQKASILPDSFSTDYVDPAHPDHVLKNISQNSIYWFIYTGTFENSVDWRCLDNVAVTPGSMFSIMWVETSPSVNSTNRPRGEFIIHRVNHQSKFSYLISTETPPKFASTEWLTFSSQNGHTEDKYQVPWGLFPFERIKYVLNDFKTPLPRLAKGSCYFSFKLNPKFIHAGYEYDKYIVRDFTEKNFVLTDNAIFYEQDKQIFTTESENTKYVLKLQENKFFKNTMFLTAQYKLENEISNNALTRVAKLYPIQGVPFDSFNISSLDRILQIEDINIRSNYSPDLESILFSSYTKLEGLFKGIKKSANGDYYVLYSYKDERGPQKTVEKSNFVSQISKIIPIRKKGSEYIDYTTTVCNFDDAKWPDGQIIQAPVIANMEAFKDLTTSTTEKLFRYFRNTLILEGEINTLTMNEISFANNPDLGDALSYVQAGDDIVEIVGLSFSKHQKLSKAKVIPEKPVYNSGGDIVGTAQYNTTLQLAKVEYKYSKFITATDDGMVTVHEIDILQNISEEINSIVYDIKEIIHNNGTNTKLTGLTFDESLQEWVLSYAHKSGQSTFVRFNADTGDCSEIDTLGGVDVNTYQVIEILDIDGRVSAIDEPKPPDIISPPKNIYAHVFARDIALTKAKLIEKNEVTFTDPKGWNGGLSKNSTVENNEAGIAISGTGSIVTGLVKAVDTGYRELHFRAKSIGGTSDNGVLNIGVENASGQVKSLYIYDRSNSEWAEISLEAITTNKPVNVLSNFRLRNLSTFKTYFVSENFVSANQDNSNITKLIPLPPPAPLCPVPMYKGEPLFTPKSYVYDKSGVPLVYNAKGTGVEPFDKGKHNPKTVQYVLFGDYNQPLDMSYPPPRYPYSGGDLYYVKTSKHDPANPETGVAYTENELLRPGTTLSYCVEKQELRPKMYNSGDKVPSNLKDSTRSPFVTINDVGMYCVKFLNKNDKKQSLKYIEQVNVYNDNNRVLEITTQTDDWKITPPPKIDGSYYKKYGHHLELDINNNTGEIEFQEVKVFVIKEFNTIPSYELVIEAKTLKVPKFKLVKNTDQEDRQNKTEDFNWVTDLVWDKQINFDSNSNSLSGTKTENFKIKDTPNQKLKTPYASSDLSSGQDAEDFAKRYLLLRPSIIGTVIKDSTISQYYDLQNAQSKKYSDSTYSYTNSLYYSDREMMAGVPMHTFWKNLPTSAKTAENPLGLLTLEDAENYRESKWYIDESIVHPPFTTTYSMPRNWPHFELPLEALKRYSTSEDWIREEYIYTQDYADYTADYLSYINSKEFADYIENLQTYWGYAGSVEYEAKLDSTGSYLGDNNIQLNGTSNNMPDTPFSRGFYKVFDEPAKVPTFLKKLPAPEDFNLVNIAAIVLKRTQEDIKFRIEISGGKGQFNIYGMKFVEFPEIEPSSSLFSREEGTYNPFLSSEYIESQRKKFLSSKYVAGNKLGYEVRLYGNKIFAYSPTKKLKKLNNNTWESDGLTEGFHWKMATLPFRRPIEKKLFQDMGFQEAYDYVKTAYDTVRTICENNRKRSGINTDGPVENSSAGTVYDKLYDWLILHEPKHFENEDQIPPVITEENVTFTITENGIVPNLTFIKLNPPKTVWNASEYEEDSLGTIKVNFLKRDNYIKYLQDYCTGILGDVRYETFFDFDDGYTPDNIKFGNPYFGFIKDIWLNESVLGIITKYDDILTINIDNLKCREDMENFNNWTITSVDPQYVLQTQSNNNFTLKSYSFGNSNGSTDFEAAYTINQWPIEYQTKGFTFNTKFIDGRHVILAGYIQANNNVVELTKYQTTLSIYNELYPNDSWKYFGDLDSNGNLLQDTAKKYPVIFYSNDFGKTFTRAEIPVEQFIPGIKTYTDEQRTAAGKIEKHSFPHIECYSIFKRGSEYHIWFKNPDVPLSQSKQDRFKQVWQERLAEFTYTPLGYTILKDIDGVLQYNNFDNIFTTFDDDEILLSATRDTNILDNVIFNLWGLNTLGVQHPLSVSATGLKVQDVTNNSIKIPAQETTEDEEFLRVLVAINPSYSVTNQAKYLSLKQEYLNHKGQFIITELLEVESKLLANRMYSFRETLRHRPGEDSDPSNVYGSEIKPIKGIPSISEDVNKSIYEYYEPVLGPGGEDVVLYREAKNNNEETIFLCNEEGNYLIERDSTRVQNYFRLWNMIEGGINPNSLVKAPTVRPDVNITTPDVELSELFNIVLKGKVFTKSFDLNVNDPNIILTTPYIEKIIKYCMGYRELKGNSINTEDVLFLKWDTDQRIKYNKFSDGSDDLSSPTDYGLAVEMIEAVDGPFGSIYNPETEADRLDKIFFKYGNISGNYVFDKKNQLVMMKYVERLHVNFNVPYLFKAMPQISPNAIIQYNDHKQIIGAPDFPVTGIYLNPNGYGGSNVNESWENIQPYECDYQAFNDEQSYNENAEIIYLTDENNNRLISNHGFFKFTAFDSAEISYDSLTEFGENKLSLYRKYPEKPGTYSLWKFAPENYAIFTPKDTLYLNCDYAIMGNVKCDPVLWNNVPETNSDYFNAYELDGHFVSILASPCYIFVNGVTQTPDENWTIKFYDGERNELKKFILKDNRILYVRDSETDMGPEKRDVLGNKIWDIKGGTITLEVTDFFGNFGRKTFNVGLHPTENNSEIGKELFKILAMNSVEFGNSVILKNRDNNVINNNKITMYIDGRSVKEGDKIDSNDQNLKLLKKFIDKPVYYAYGNNNPKKVVNSIIELMVDGLPILTTMVCESKLDSAIKDTFEPDLRFINGINIYTDRLWSAGNPPEGDLQKGGIQAKVFAKNQDLSDRFAMSIVKDENQYYVEAKDAIMLTLKSKPIEIIGQDVQPDITVTLDKFTFVQGESVPFNYFNKEGPVDQNETIIIDGLRGNVMLRNPVYRNFKELLDIKHSIIPYRERRIIGTYDNIKAELLNTFDSVSPKYDFVKLTDPINYRNFGDGKLHNVKIRVMPIASVDLDVNNMNDPEYYNEIELVERNIFDYDRVWINPEGYPPPPVTINGVVYNEENTINYYNRPYRNQTRKLVYECNEQGKYVRNVVMPDGLDKIIMGDEKGSLAKEIYANIDKRFNLPEPIYKSTSDWFLNEFYIKGHESNPFWQWIEISEEYDPSSGLWNQTARITEDVKNIFEMKRVDVSPEDIYCFLEKNILYYQQANKIVSLPDRDFIDYSDGHVLFTAGYPAAQYKNKRFIVKYGIRYLNTFYPGEENRDVWKGFSQIKHEMSMTYDTNTTENYANSTDKDASIVEITEMGLFNKNHELVAYMVHPKAQYRSESQHLSYNLLIRNKNIPILNKDVS
jgi:hypothetical protein